MILLAGLAAAVAAAIGMLNWRWALTGLLLFLPFSGIPIILSYPDTQLTVLLKDGLFVLPAYAGFVLARSGQRDGSFPSPLLLPVGALTALVAAESLQQLSNPMVALIGAKVWLFYVPLLVLGYHLPRSRSDLGSLLTLMSLAGLLPVVIAVVEAVLLDSGQSGLVYHWYGQAASAVTQNFTDVGYASGATLLRVPGTFSSASQHYGFLSAMVVVTFATWQLTGRRWALGMFLLSLVASFTCGLRAAFVMTPLLVLLIVLTGRSVRRAAASSMLVGTGALVAAGLLGLSASVLLGYATRIGAAEVYTGFVTGLPRALQLSPLGLGTGHATGASRYAEGGSDQLLLAGQVLSESWWVKAVLELGAAGLVVVVALTGAVLLAGWRSHVSVADPKLRAVSAALLAFLAWTLVYLTKGVAIDLDPINVYFWLFAGILVRLSGLESVPAAVPASMAARHPEPARWLRSGHA